MTGAGTGILNEKINLAGMCGILPPWTNVVVLRQSHHCGQRGDAILSMWAIWQEFHKRVLTYMDLFPHMLKSVISCLI